MAASGFGQRVRQARLHFAARKGEEVSQSDLARLLGVEPSTVNRWEAGAKQPSFETVERLAEVLGVSPAYLAFGIMDAPLTAAEPGAPNAIRVSGEVQDEPTPPVPEPAAPPPQRPHKEVARHAKAPLIPIRKDDGKGRKKA